MPSAQSDEISATSPGVGKISETISDTPVKQSCLLSRRRCSKRAFCRKHCAASLPRRPSAVNTSFRMADRRTVAWKLSARHAEQGQQTTVCGSSSSHPPRCDGPTMGTVRLNAWESVRGLRPIRRYYAGFRQDFGRTGGSDVLGQFDDYICLGHSVLLSIFCPSPGCGCHLWSPDTNR